MKPALLLSLSAVLLTFPFAKLIGLPPGLVYVPIIFSGALLLYKRKGALPGAKWLTPLWIWSATLLLSVPTALYPGESLSKWLTFSLMTIYGYLVLFAVSRYGLRWLVYAVSVLVVCLSFAMIVLTAKLGSVKHGMQDEIGYFATNAGLFLIGSTPFVLFGQLHRYLSLPTAGCLLVLIVVAAASGGARAPIVLIPVALALHILLTYGLSWRLVAIAIGLPSLLGAAFLGSYQFSPTIAESVNRAAERAVESALIESVVSPRSLDSDERSDRLRIDMFAVGKQWVSESPFVGIGFGGFMHHMESQLGYGTRSHNAVVTAWAEGGALSLLAFLYLLSAAATRLVQSRGSGESLRNLCIVGLSIISIHWFGQPQEYNPFFFIYIALTLALPALSYPILWRPSRHPRIPVIVSSS